VKEEGYEDLYLNLSQFFWTSASISRDWERVKKRDMGICTWILTQFFWANPSILRVWERVKEEAYEDLYLDFGAKKGDMGICTWILAQFFWTNPSISRG
jgi:hypothetical protein